MLHMFHRLEAFAIDQTDWDTATKYLNILFKLPILYEKV